METDNTMSDDDAKSAARARSEAYRDRRRHNRALVSVEVTVDQARALERLGLFDVEGGKPALAWAVARFLATAPHVSAIGDAMFPEAENWKA